MESRTLKLVNQVMDVISGPRPQIPVRDSLQATSRCPAAITMPTSHDHRARALVVGCLSRCPPPAPPPAARRLAAACHPPHVLPPACESSRTSSDLDICHGFSIIV